jgi:hypothetical protein
VFLYPVIKLDKEQKHQGQNGSDDDHFGLVVVHQNRHYEA